MFCCYLFVYNCLVVYVAVANNIGEGVDDVIVYELVYMCGWGMHLENEKMHLHEIAHTICNPLIKILYIY